MFILGYRGKSHLYRGKQNKIDKDGACIRMKELNFPFDGNYIRKNRRKIKRQLLSDGSERIRKKVAILGGSTVSDVVSVLELFLLNFGIEPDFYVSEYNKFFEDAVFGTPELDDFGPDIIYIHTTSRNLTLIPGDTSESEEQVRKRIDEQFGIFRKVWECLSSKFDCPVIQNNFELLPYRHTGSYDCWSIHGTTSFINRLNIMMADYARKKDGFYINDINYLSSCAGLEKWHDPEAWFLYKYAMSLDVIPDLAYSVACIIKSVFGKNKKVISLDLDNTLWGGVIGDDGRDGIEIGPETPVGQSYSEFQEFIKGYKNYGILLTVCSKNDEENASLGLTHPESVLKPEDFVSIKSNWDDKDRNIEQTAADLSLLTESFVFIDDNPAECEIVSSQLPEVDTVNFTSAGDAMYILSRSGFFEVTSFSDDDVRRGKMYEDNINRERSKKNFENYHDFLLSLEMEAEIDDFQPVYLKRITQLTNKSNQFNLTTRRYTENEMDLICKSKRHIRLYGRLRDKFGDNGVVSVVIGKCEGDVLDIELWLMSCRVLKRDLESAMLDALVEKCREKGIKTVRGYYYKTKKNGIVANLFGTLGFDLVSVSENGDSVWKLNTENYVPKNSVIRITGFCSDMTG